MRLLTLGQALAAVVCSRGVLATYVPGAAVSEVVQVAEFEKPLLMLSRNHFQPCSQTATAASDVPASTGILHGTRTRNLLAGTADPSHQSASYY